MRRLETHSLELLARFGYAARGIVYLLVGGLAVLAAVGFGGQTGGSRSALATLLLQPFGRVWLGLIAVGLMGFAVWRIVEAAADADHLGSSYKALAKRAGHVMSGLLYGGLAVSAAQLALGQRRGGGDDQAAQDWTAWVLEKPLGQWAVGLVGLIVLGVGAAFLLKGWKGDVLQRLMPPAEVRQWAVPMGRLGFAARGVVFVLIGGFLILAAFQSTSSDVKGLGGALHVLQHQPYGWALLAITALGLAAFGLFGLVQARYRHIDPPDVAGAKAAVESAVSRRRAADRDGRPPHERTSSGSSADPDEGEVHELNTAAQRGTLGSL
ncbi:DUF1206 domain-containing protein [Methylobacterium isbiliense]|jgi:hypothetical protein|uniref:DUF1206 domain-containing protein n=1 Tax=Methylobacterium isbiliense TaxID=315478 RepID=A0ABQ4SQW3_9HYPH|nr:DUF1206 domain-containing protein [Methylobacterium isbiliense]MDN3627913.1 DUF1206 domain-containing protein [Methylobacterium isbiliense]GJE04681.1 hypothetical protein GMJLKIPL_6647 [Methylobacterium isbiliense]